MASDEPVRVLRFPEDRSWGQLSDIVEPSGPSSARATWDRDARGVVQVPRSTRLRLLWDGPGDGLTLLDSFAADEFEELNFGKTFTLTDDQLAHLTRLRGLRSLALHQNPITDQGLAHLAPLTGIEDLWLSCGSGLTSAGLRYLRGLRHLRLLDLSHTWVDDAGVELLSRLPRLERLYLSYTRVTDIGLHWLAALPDLQDLGLAGTGVTNDGLREIGRLANLRKLELASTAVGVEGLRHLIELDGLEELSLPITATSDAAIPYILRHPNMRTLDLRRTQVTLEGALQLAALRHLEVLEVPYAIGMEGWQRLMAAMPWCQVRKPYRLG